MKTIGGEWTLIHDGQYIPVTDTTVFPDDVIIRWMLEQRRDTYTIYVSPKGAGMHRRRFSHLTDDYGFLKSDYIRIYGKEYAEFFGRNGPQQAKAYLDERVEQKLCWISKE